MSLSGFVCAKLAIPRRRIFRQRLAPRCIPSQSTSTARSGYLIDEINSPFATGKPRRCAWAQSGFAKTKIALPHVFAEAKSRPSLRTTTARPCLTMFIGFRKSKQLQTARRQYSSFGCRSTTIKSSSLLPRRLKVNPLRVRTCRPRSHDKIHPTAGQSGFAHRVATCRQSHGTRRKV